MPTSSEIADITIQSTARAMTMAVINPWMYMSGTEAMLQVATTVAMKATTYMLQELQKNLQMSAGVSQENLAVELMGQSFQLTELAIQQAAISPNIAKFFLFRLNPAKLDRRYAKARSNTFSGAGLIMDTHGNQGITYSYAGTMGSMRPALGALRLPQLTAAWHYLHLFRKFFLHHDQDLIFVLDDEASVGRFDTFDFSLDANNPWLINYRFQVTMYPNTEFHLLDGYVGAAFNAVKGNIPALKDPFGVEKSQEDSHINVFDDTYGVKHAEQLSIA